MGRRKKMICSAGMTTRISSQWHTLALDLGHPCRCTLGRLVALVVLVERAAKKLAAGNALRLIKGVAAGIHTTHHLCTSSLETAVDFLNAVTEVLAVAGGVAASEDRDGLVGEVGGLDVVDEVIPRNAGPVLICAGVPRRRAHDQTIIARQILRSVFANISGLHASRVRNRPSDSFSVPSLSGVEEPHGFHRRAAWLPRSGGERGTASRQCE